jgi:ferredoxin
MVLLWRARRKDGSFVLLSQPPLRPRLALIGARSCDLHAIAIQDRILMHGEYADPEYAARRSDVFVVAVQCSKAGSTCFCASMGTGPRATSGFDLAVTEVLEGAHRFVIELATDRGAEVVARIPHRPATDEDEQQIDRITTHTAQSMGRHMDTHGIRELLRDTLDHPRWDQVATRCLSCTNCTLVCPTCFCADIEDTTDLAGVEAQRTRRWDSCFTLGHSYVHGGSVRTSIKSRYRQWLTHKLGTWIDQFGMSGCVGCGRCITWCPVGIDITEEVAALRRPAAETSP